ncbi:MAG: hypothetical protein ACLQDM_12855 [Bradyrhizobium sp.]
MTKPMQRFSFLVCAVVGTFALSSLARAQDVVVGVNAWYRPPGMSQEEFIKQLADNGVKTIRISFPGSVDFIIQAYSHGIGTLAIVPPHAGSKAKPRHSSFDIPLSECNPIVLAESGSVVGIALVGDHNESIESAMSRLHNTAYELGMSVAADSGALTELLPGLVRTRSDQIWSFGRGLAQGADHPAKIWTQLVAQLQPFPAEGANLGVFRGFLNGLHQKNAALAEAMLDDAIHDDALAQWYPALETAIGEINEHGLRRLLRSLERGKAPIDNYRFLEGGRVTDGLSGPDVKTLLLRISDHRDGIYVAVEILYMRLFSDQGGISSDEFVEIGCELMLRLDVTRNTDPNFAQRLQIVGRHCLLGDNGAATVREVCTKLRNAISRSEASAYGHREFLQILFNAQPLAVLRSLCAGDDAAMVKIGVRVLENADLLHPHSFDVIPEEELLRWCDELPDVRYPIAAAGIAAIRHDTDGPHWADIARKILEKSRDRVQVLKKFIRQFSLPGWDMSRAAEVQSNLRLLDDMAAYSDPALVEFAGEEKARLSQVITAVREVSPPVFDMDPEGFE